MKVHGIMSPIHDLPDPTRQEVVSTLESSLKESCILEPLVIPTDSFSENID